MQVSLQFFEREYLKPQVKGTIKWVKMQISLQFFEREYLKPQVKDSANWVQNKKNEINFAWSEWKEAKICFHSLQAKLTFR